MPDNIMCVSVAILEEKSSACIFRDSLVPANIKCVNIAILEYNNLAGT